MTSDHVLSTVVLLRMYQCKAACVWTQCRATQIWRELEPRLDDIDRTRLRVAWSHWFIGEGRRELDTVVNDIVQRRRTRP